MELLDFINTEHTSGELCPTACSYVLLPEEFNTACPKCNTPITKLVGKDKTFQLFFRTETFYKDIHSINEFNYFPWERLHTTLNGMSDRVNSGWDSVGLETKGYIPNLTALAPTIVFYGMGPENTAIQDIWEVPEGLKTLADFHEIRGRNDFASRLRKLTNPQPF